MLKLCGFSISNYYNKVKLALLEKGVSFEEEHVSPAQTEEVLRDSPMGKIPFLRTDRGVLSESQALIEYIEDVFPEPPLYPGDPYERARNRELIQHIELHVELPARRLYAEAFFGGSVSAETKVEVEKLLRKGLRSLAQLGRFSPYIAGDFFTYADCAAWVHLPVVSQAARVIYGHDIVEELLPATKAYVKFIGERPHARRVNADRKAAMESFVAKKKA